MRNYSCRRAAYKKAALTRFFWFSGESFGFGDGLFECGEVVAEARWAVAGAPESGEIVSHRPHITRETSQHSGGDFLSGVEVAAEKYPPAGEGVHPPGQVELFHRNRLKFAQAGDFRYPQVLHLRQSPPQVG